LETTELTIANVAEPAVRRRQAAVACSACAPIREQWPHDFASAPLLRSREQRASQRSRATTKAKTLSKSNGRSEVPNAATSVIHRKKAAFEA